MGSFWNEINHSLQMSGKNPAFTIAVLITLALGTGTNTAIFSVVDAVLLKPFTYPDADRMVEFYHNPVTEV